MKAVIWDLDGTLLDSYPGIVKALELTYDEFNVNLDKKDIYRYITDTSVYTLLLEISKLINRPVEEIKAYYSSIDTEILVPFKLIDGAYEALDGLSKNGVTNFIYTHRGIRTNDIIKNLGIDKFFKEVVTSANGLKRKPEPDGIDYLVNKYNLDKKNVFYCGDRLLDIDSSFNAGTRGILFKDLSSCITPNGKEKFIINKLTDIIEIVGE